MGINGVEKMAEIEGKNQPDMASIGDLLRGILETVKNIIDWFKNFPEHLTTFVTTVISTIYDLISDLILTTPLWIFENVWFDNMSYLLSIVAIGVVTILTIINGFKQKLQKKHTDLKTIAKRWFVVAGISSIVPTLVYYFFKFINWVSNSIMNISSIHIKNPLTPSLSGLDLIILTIFGVVMVGQTVPLLLRQGKRFFSLLNLSIIAPLAGTAWIFESHNHLFEQWWSNLWRLSIIQVVYAFFLLVIGLFLYGIPTPETFTGIATKMLITVGGFMSLVDPPNFVSRYLWNGDVTGMVKNGKESYKKVKNGLGLGRTAIGKTIGAVKLLTQSPQPKLINSTATTRMGRRSAMPINTTRMIKNHGKFRRK